MIRNNDSSLFTQLVTADERNDAYRKNEGQYSSYFGDHAFDLCSQNFIHKLAQSQNLQNAEAGNVGNDASTHTARIPNRNAQTSKTFLLQPTSAYLRLAVRRTIAAATLTRKSTARW